MARNERRTRISPTPPPLLQLEDIDTYYGQIHILQDQNRRRRRGPLPARRQRVGKSTTLKTILGLVRPRTGTVKLEQARHEPIRRLTG